MTDSKAEASAEQEPIDTGLVRELASILNDTDLTEIEVERGDLRIRVARETHTVQAVAAAPVAALPAATPATAAAPAVPAEAKGELVKSPMVGTIYLSPQPGSPVFVKPGDTVTEGQTVMIVEAMKTMNPIPAPRAGKVLEIRVRDAQPVEFGEGLLVLE